MRSLLTALARSCPLGVALCLIAVSAHAQEPQPAAIDSLRSDSWNYGFQLYGGKAAMATPRTPHVQSSYPGSLGAEFHIGHVLFGEHGEGWRRGTFEWDFSIIPVSLFFANGHTYYMGGGAAASPRWNFTRMSRRVVPFFGFECGLLFGPDKFPPGDTARTNFTAAMELGGHWLNHRRRSFDSTVRLYHLSNAGIGHYNPGVPLSIQLMFGYTWY